MARDLRLEVVLQGLDRLSRPLREAGRSSVGLARDLKGSRDELKGLQAQQRDISSFRALRAASEQSGKALLASQQRIKDLRQSMASATGSTKQLNAEFRRVVREAQALKAKHGEQQAQLQGLRGKLTSAGISTRNLGQHERELRTRMAATNQTISQQEARLKRLTSQQQRLAAAKQSYERTQAMAGSMAGTGAAGLATGSGILYGGARLLSPGLDFDASMSKVQALSRLDAGSADLQALRTQARELGASTQFTAGQAADAQGYLAMAGFDAKAIQSAMPGMLSLAKAGDSDLAETADIASNILTGFKLQADDMGKLGDVLVGAFTRSNVNLQMLGETMKYVGPVASSVGQDIETVAAMAGKLGDAGIQGSMGGTALRAILGRLSAPPKSAAKALDKLGISAIDAQGNLRDMPTVLQEIYEKTKGMGDATRAGLLKDIAGEEAVAGLQVLVAQAGSGSLQEFIGTLREAGGDASRTASVMADNMRGDLAALGSAWDDLGIQLQEQQDGPLREITQGLTGLVGGIKSWTAENPKLAAGLVKAAAGLGMLMAGMGVITLGLASILGPFAMVRYGMTLLGLRSVSLIGTLYTLGRNALPLVAKGVMLIGRALMMNPIGLAITAIAAGAYLIYRNWDRVGPYFLGLWQEIKDGFGGGLSGIAGLIVNFSPLGLFYRAFAGVMSYFGVELPGKFTEFGANILQGLANGITSAMGSVKTAITGAGDATVGWFKQKLGIHSPSRVFAELGGFTMAGLEQGLTKGQGGPLGAVVGMGKQLAAAGALALGVGGAGSAMAIDSRPPLVAGTGAAPMVVQGDTLNITINATPGTDTAGLRQMLNQLLDERERGKAARLRASLHDRD